MSLLIIASVTSLSTFEWISSDTCDLRALSIWVLSNLVFPWPKLRSFPLLGTSCYRNLIAAELFLVNSDARGTLNTFNSIIPLRTRACLQKGGCPGTHCWWRARSRASPRASFSLWGSLLIICWGHPMPVCPGPADRTGAVVCALFPFSHA